MLRLSSQLPTVRVTRKLAPRAAQTLWGLLQGLSEKQIAARLAISKNTVHTYVKALYATFEVSSRSELLAMWIGTTPEMGLAPTSALLDKTANLLAELHAERDRLVQLLAKLDQEILEEKRALELRGNGEADAFDLHRSP